MSCVWGSFEEGGEQTAGHVVTAVCGDHTLAGTDGVDVMLFPMRKGQAVDSLRVREW